LPAPFRNVLIVYNTSAYCPERAASSTAPLIHFLISAYMYHFLRLLTSYASSLIRFLHFFPTYVRIKGGRFQALHSGGIVREIDGRPTSAIILIVLHARETTQFRDRRWSVTISTSGRDRCPFRVSLSRPFALCRYNAGWTQACNKGSRYVAIATQPVPRLQIRPIVHNQEAASTTPPSYIRVRAVVWAWGLGHAHIDTQTHGHTDARDHNTFCVVYDSRKI